MGFKRQEAAKNSTETLLNPKEDRRLLNYVPGEGEYKRNTDRRGQNTGAEGEEGVYVGLRYETRYKVKVSCPRKKKKVFYCESLDISDTGILLKVSEEQREYLKRSEEAVLTFEISQGTMPEGYESTVRIKAGYARENRAKEGEYLVGLAFEERLSTNIERRRGRYLLWLSAMLLFGTSVFVLLMRLESIVYFEFNKYLYLYSIIAAIFLLSRYFFGMLYRPVKVEEDFTPGVSVIIPCYNEEEWIERTIVSCINQDYPISKLEVIVVDDCSRDNSRTVIENTIRKLREEGEVYRLKERLSVIFMKENKGKREALALGTQAAVHELVVFVDSDSFLEPRAIRSLVQPFRDPKVGGAAGRTDVANTYTNALTKMQSVRYYIAFRIMKAAESYFDSVTCLSGPLACYRKSIVEENLTRWLEQRFLGQKATFGDDRSLTNMVLRNHRTVYQDTAVCHTIVPRDYRVFLRQQMRWKRSWLRESMVAGKFIWRKEPFMAFFFYIGLLVPLAAPVIVVYNLMYVPLANHIIPVTFLAGLFLMAALMSFSQLLFRKSSTWVYGFYFCLFYEAVLLWQMPIAWLTFWKSTWGTRMTPKDLEAREKRKKKGGSLWQKAMKEKRR